MGGTGAAESLQWGPALVGMAVGAVSGFFAIKLVNYIVKSDKFGIFAWYTLALGITVIIIAIIEMFSGNMIQNMIISFLA